jgi:hypothetical protein
VLEFLTSLHALRETSCLPCTNFAVHIFSCAQRKKLVKNNVCYAFIPWHDKHFFSWTLLCPQPMLLCLEPLAWSFPLPCVCGGGGSKNRMESPNTRFWSKHTKVTKKWGTRNPQKSVFVLKVVNPFTRALTPPFIGRRRDFYIPRLPLNLKNIPTVNMYTNVFLIPWFAGLISYIYKPVTSSHFKPGLLRWRLWLGLKLHSWKSSLVKIPELRLLKIAELRGFLIS